MKIHTHTGARRGKDERWTHGTRNAKITNAGHVDSWRAHVWMHIRTGRSEETIRPVSPSSAWRCRADSQHHHLTAEDTLADRLRGNGKISSARSCKPSIQLAGAPGGASHSASARTTRKTLRYRPNRDGPTAAAVRQVLVSGEEQLDISTQAVGSCPRAASEGGPVRTAQSSCRQRPRAGCCAGELVPVLICPSDRLSVRLSVCPSRHTAKSSTGAYPAYHGCRSIYPCTGTDRLREAGGKGENRKGGGWQEPW